MKPLFVLLTVISSFFVQNSFAAKDDVAPIVLQSFQQAFNNAKEVSWTATSNFYKADFALNGQYVSAFYDGLGELVAMTRNITSFQLPIYLQANLKKDYTAYWITDLFEVTNEDGTTYYATLENADTKVVLKSASASKWSTFQKNSKQ